MAAATESAFSHGVRWHLASFTRTQPGVRIEGFGSAIAANAARNISSVRAGGLVASQTSIRTPGFSFYPMISDTLFPTPAEPEATEPAVETAPAADISEPETEAPAEQQEQSKEGAEGGAHHAEFSPYQRVKLARWNAFNSLLSQGVVGCRNALKSDPDCLEKADDPRAFAAQEYRMQLAWIALKQEIELVLLGARDMEIGARTVITPKKSIIIPGQR